MAVDWLTIRNDYINGGGSYRSIAEKYGVSFSTLKDVAVREKWKEAKEQQTNKTRIKIEQKTQEKISDAISEQAAAKARIGTKIIGIVENWLNKNPDCEDAGDIRRMVQCAVDMGIFAIDANADEKDKKQIDAHAALIKAITERNNGN